MTGWAALLLLIGAALALTMRLGVPRRLTWWTGAALMLGATGYALQGRPGLEGQPATVVAQAGVVDPNISALRLAMFGRYTVAESYFAAGDALIRSGSPRTAAALYLGAVNAQAQNAALWTALGGAIVEVDGGAMSPTARFAFDRAIRLAPDHPGPAFFLGLALVRAGAFREARGWWLRAYLLTSPRLSYRRDIANRLALLDQFLASEAGRSAG